MCHRALLDAKFWAFLLCIDEDLAAETRARGCRRCGAKLHRDLYPRKPRGGPGDLGGAYRRRLSFTCSVCDKRHTPASVRFLGQRVYLAATVVLASAVRSGLTGWRVSQLTEWIGVPKRTLERWRAWWQHEFVDTRFWVIERGRFMPPPASAALPSSLLDRFEGPDLPSQLIATLRFLAPLAEGR
jgi:hypothetical protein